MNGGWINILFILVVIGAPVLKQIIDAIQRKKEARLIEQERDRRQIDALRTGTTASSAAKESPRAAQYQQSGQVSAANRLQEIQEKRRAALERARQQARSGMDPAASASTRPTTPSSVVRSSPAPRTRSIQTAPMPSQSAPRPGSPGPLIGGRAPLPSRQPSRTAQPQQRQQRVAPVAKPLGTLLSQTTRRKRAAHARQGDHSSVHRLVADAEEGAKIEQTHAAVSPGELSKMSVSDWRKAMVLQELMGPPIALRD